MFTSTTKVTILVAALCALSPLAAKSLSNIHHHAPKLTCDDKAKGPFNSVHQYTCGYEAFRDNSMVLADPAKMKEFVSLWSPAVLAQAPELKMIGVSEADREKLTFSLLRRMRDFTHERFDYVETAEEIAEQNADEVRPVTEGGIGLGLKLENQWMIDKEMSAIAQIDGITEDELAAHMKQLSVISPKHRVIVESVSQGSPSDGKMQNDDIVMAVDGNSIVGQNLDDVVDKQIHGKAGTTVNLEVLRKNAQGQLQDLTISLVRQDFADRTVSVEDLDGVRHITVGDFVNDHLLGDFARALSEAKALHLKGVDVNIRDNGGGRVDYVIAMLEMVEDRGLILSLRERKVGATEVKQTDYTMLDGFGLTVTHPVGSLDKPSVVYSRRVAFTPEYEVEARQNPDYFIEHPLLPIIDSDMPVVVTQNGGSYSASEIFAGAIQATHRGKINGKPSGGKGAIMTVVNLPEGGQVSVTEGQFYPGGKDTKYIGILPDYDVAQADDFGKTDAQKAKAEEIIDEAYDRLQALKSEAAAQAKINNDRFEKEMAARDADDKKPVELEDATAKK